MTETKPERRWIVPKDPTKADLLEALTERDAEIHKLDQQERESAGAARTWKDRAETAEGKLAAGRQAIIQALSVQHDMTISPAGVWLGGRFIEEGEEPTQTVRLLRHLHAMLGDA